ncbi:MAG: hypothetical protein M3022_06080 [Actinomycetota bacterium]|nr:hypothetical protein [Actinomycetota bacterium]
MVNANETRTEKGLSLSRGPALVLGTILLAAGLYFLYTQHTFAKFSNFPDGSAPVTGKVLFGIFGANGWTGMLTAVGGGLLLFGAAQHLLAKTMSLIVGLALGAAAIIALASGNVLGMAAANGWTELGWGVAAAILLFNAVVPRRKRVVSDGAVSDRGVSDRGTSRTHRREAEAAAAGAGAVAEHHHEKHVRDDQTAREDRTEAREGVGTEDRTAVHGSATSRDQTVAHGGATGEDPTVAQHRAAGESSVSEEDRLRTGREG